jgi:carbonic anhydrase
MPKTATNQVASGPAVQRRAERFAEERRLETRKYGFVRVTLEPRYFMPNRKLEADPRQSSRRCFFPELGVMALAGTAFAEAKQPSRLLAAALDDDLVVPLTKAARDALRPEDVIARIKAGNERFRSGSKQHRDVLEELKKTAGGQWPEAVVLGCIDSRAPAEIIFDQGLGDIFNCRVAGNVESADMLGSLEFATKLSGAKLVAIMGHSGCGAVKGAIADAELGNLTQLLAKIRPAIAWTIYQGKRSADNPEFVDAVARTSVALTVDRIRKGSTVLAELETAGSIKLVGCFYNVSTGGIEFSN